MTAAKSHYLQLAALLPNSAGKFYSGSPPSIEDLAVVLEVAAEASTLPAIGDPRVLSALDAPPELAHDLATIFELNSRRNEELRQQAFAVIRCLNEAGIAPMAVKGAADFLDRVYPSPGGLCTADIDFVVAEADVARSYEVLLRAGYEATADLNPGSHHHLPALVHRRTGTVVEIHRRLTRRGMGALLPEAEYWKRARLVLEPQTGCWYALHPTDALIHNIVHAQLQHHAWFCGAVPVKGLYQFALLARKHGAEIDWARVTDARGVAFYRKAARWHMDLAAELFPWSGVPAPKEHDPFVRAKIDLSPSAKQLRLRQMAMLSCFVYDPALACSRIWGGGLSAAKLRGYWSALRAAARDMLGARKREGPPTASAAEALVQAGESAS